MRSAGEPVIGAVVAALLAGPAALHAQAPAAARSEIVTYQNPVDSLPLSPNSSFLPVRARFRAWSCSPSRARGS